MSEKEKRLRTLDEEIARHLEEASRSGELKAVKHYGKPIPEDAGWDATPEALRMPMKILKDAGVTPAEIEWFHDRARLRAELEAAMDDAQRETVRAKLSALEQKIALRLEALRINSNI